MARIEFLKNNRADYAGRVFAKGQFHHVFSIFYPTLSATLNPSFCAVEQASQSSSPYLRLPKSIWTFSLVPTITLVRLRSSRLRACGFRLLPFGLAAFDVA